jgi:hypothetical protein
MIRRTTAPSREERNGVELKSFSVEVFALRNGISRSQAYKELASGRLEGVKCGARTLITDRAERKWQRALPKVIPKDAKAKSPNGGGTAGATKRELHREGKEC